MTREDISELLRSVDRPVNVLAGLRGMALDVGALSELGVRRISVGGLLAQTAFGAFWRAAQELSSSGTFAFAEGAVSYGTIRKVLDS
jgi:2-methylisocitrate lyase-like PEP mutase family enzyme